MEQQNKVGSILQAASPLLSAIPGVGAILGPAASIIGGLLPPPTSYEPAGEAKGGFGYAKGGRLDPQVMSKILQSGKFGKKKLSKDQKEFLNFAMAKQALSNGGIVGKDGKDPKDSYKWQYGFEHVDTSGADMEVDSNVIPVVPNKPLHPQHRFFQYAEPEKVLNTRTFQAENDLPVTGFAGPATRQKMLMNDPEYAAEVLGSQRAAYQAKVREAGAKIKDGDFFGMDPIMKESLKKSGITKVNECIGGVCNFIRSNIDPEIVGNYTSNYLFDDDAKAKGWNYRNKIKHGRPDIGDMIQVRYPRPDNPEQNARHMMYITDFDGTNYTIVDNAGKDSARVRKFSKEELEKKINEPSKFENWGIYSKSFPDDKVRITKKSKPAQEQTFDRSAFNLRVAPGAQVNRKTDRFVAGVDAAANADDNPYTPQADAERIAIMSAALTGRESDGGTSMRYNAKRYLPGPAKAYRAIKQDESLLAPLSAGLSQIDPAQLSPQIKEKYFKNKSDRQIERKLFNNNELAGKVTYDVLKERYTNMRNNPNLYNQDPQMFWYSLAKAWQNPSFATTDKGKEQLYQQNIPYSEEVFNDLSKFYVERPNYAKGGKMCMQCGGKMKRNSGGQMSPDLSVLQGGQLNQMSPSTVEVQANTPGALDSVELPQAYVSDDETISQMQDGSKYVFSDVLKNPFSGKTFAEEDKKLAKMEAKVMNKKTKYGKPEQGTLKIINQQREQLAGLNDMMRQLDELKNGTTSVAGKPAAQGGMRMPQDNLQSPYFMPQQIQNPGFFQLPMATVTAQRPNALQRLNTVDDQFMTGLWNGLGGNEIYPKDAPAPFTTNWFKEPVNAPLRAVAPLFNSPPTNRYGNGIQPDPGVMQATQAANPNIYQRQTVSPGYTPTPQRAATPTNLAAGREALQMGMSQIPYTQSTTQALSQSPQTAQPVQGGTTSAVGKKTAGKKANPKAVVAKSTTPNWMQRFQGSAQTATGGYDRVDPTTGAIIRSATGVDPFQYYPNMPSSTAQLPTIKVGDGGKPLQSMTAKKLGALTKDGHMLARPRGSTVTNKAGGQGAGNIFGNGNINHLLQFGELASKAALLLRGYDRPQQNTAPISYSPMDPSNALMQNQYAFNAAQQDLNNSSSGATLNANVQQLAANKMRGNAQVMTQYDNMNKQLFTNYQDRLGQRAAENIQYKHIGQADEAAYYNQMYDILTSVGNIGRAGQASKDNKNAAQLIIQSYPQIAQYMQEAFKNMKLNIPAG